MSLKDKKVKKVRKEQRHPHLPTAKGILLDQNLLSIMIGVLQFGRILKNRSDLRDFIGALREKARTPMPLTSPISLFFQDINTVSDIGFL